MAIVHQDLQSLELNITVMHNIDLIVMLDEKFNDDIMRVAQKMALSRGINRKPLSWASDAVKDMVKELVGNFDDMSIKEQKTVLTEFAERMSDANRLAYEDLQGEAMTMILLRGMFTHPEEGSELIPELADELPPPPDGYFKQIDGLVPYYRRDNMWERRYYYLLALFKADPDIETSLYAMRKDIDEWNDAIKLSGGDEARFQRVLLERNMASEDDRNGKRDKPKPTVIIEALPETEGEPQ